MRTTLDVRGAPRITRRELLTFQILSYGLRTPQRPGRTLECIHLPGWTSVLPGLAMFLMISSLKFPGDCPGGLEALFPTSRRPCDWGRPGGVGPLGCRRRVHRSGEFDLPEDFPQRLDRFNYFSCLCIHSAVTEVTSDSASSLVQPDPTGRS